MRLVYEEYADGGYGLFETEDDGTNRHALEASPGKKSSVRRIIAFVSASFDGNRAGKQSAAKAFERLLEQVKPNGRPAPHVKKPNGLKKPRLRR